MQPLSFHFFGGISDIGTACLKRNKESKPNSIEVGLDFIDMLACTSATLVHYHALGSKG